MVGPVKQILKASVSRVKTPGDRRGTPAQDAIQVIPELLVQPFCLAD